MFTKIEFDYFFTFYGYMLLELSNHLGCYNKRCEKGGRIHPPGKIKGPGYKSTYPWTTVYESVLNSNNPI